MIDADEEDGSPRKPSSSATPQLILIVDDDRVLRERLARAFRDRGHRVATAGDLGEALAAARELRPSRVVADLRMPDGSGLELVRTLRSLDENVEIVVLTGYGSIATAIEAIRLGATYYLHKPADADDILDAFARGAAPRPETDCGATTRSAPAIASEKAAEVSALAVAPVGARRDRFRIARRGRRASGSRARSAAPCCSGSREGRQRSPR
jgi:two-component system response regulator RegA